MSLIQTQSAEVNNSNNPCQSTHFNMRVSDMGEQRYLQYTQARTNYDNNVMVQNESLLHSLAQNPNMANDFYQFLEFTRARSVQQQQVQFNYNEQISNQQQQQIPSLISFKAGFDENSSTPKRSRPLNESGGSLSSAPKQHKATDAIHGDNGPINSDQQRVSLPFEQLRRAVSSNLPCFYIEFDQSSSVLKLPSALEARDFIEKHFKEHNIRIQHFSLVGWANTRLKLGVNNKEDYTVLVTTDNWPSEIKGVPVKVTKPKFVPDCFALVVRYVPRGLDLEFVTEEIKRTIASAVDIKQIKYPYERKSNDFRFSVTNLTEYKAARQLGRIAIGNRWLGVTPFLTGNRMTYCTRCWKIGHMREQCKTNGQRCRVCLEEITTRTEHNCSKVPKCAQCEGEHHSLNSECQVIRQYRADLKEDVDKALESGKLHRNDTTKSQLGPKLDNEVFPPLAGSKKHQESVWNREQTAPCGDATSDTTNILLRINENLMEMRESNRRVEEKIEKINTLGNQTALDVELHQTTVNNLIECMQSLIHDVLGDVTAQVKPELLKSKTGLQSIYDTLRELKTNLNKDYETRRKRPVSPPAHLPPDKQSGTDGKKNNDNAHTKNKNK